MKDLRVDACRTSLVGVLGASSHPSDEAQVRAAIDQVATAVRVADASKLADVLSDDFDGDGDHLDKRSLINMLHLLRLRGQSIKVLLGPVSIERRGRHLMVTFTVILRLSGDGGWLQHLPDMFHVSSGWRNEGGQWRCCSATWECVLH